MVMRVSVLCAVMALAAPAFAQDAPPATPAAPAAAAAPAATPVKPKKACRQEMATGSIMPKRICHTPEEWAQIDRANAAVTGQFDNARRQSRGGMMGN